MSVSGTFTAVGPTSGISPSAAIYDGGGRQIGFDNGPLTVFSGQPIRAIQFVVPISGTPASCRVMWKSGPH